MRSLVFLIVVVAFACGGTESSKPTPPSVGSTSASATSPARTASRDACNAHKQSLREEYCDPDAPNEPCAADDFACELRLDVDGDGAKELVVVEAHGDTITLAVVWADGSRDQIATSAHPLVDAEVGDSFEDFSWLLYWDVITKTDRGFFQDIVGKRRKLPIKGADGDALFVSGGDAAAAVFHRGGAFVMENLGF